MQDKSQTWQLGISALWSLAFLLASSPIYTPATRGHLQFPELLMLFHVSMSLQIWSPFSMTHHSLPDWLSFFLFITSFCKKFSVSLQLSYPLCDPPRAFWSYFYWHLSYWIIIVFIHVSLRISPFNALKGRTISCLPLPLPAHIGHTICWICERLMKI